MERIGLKMEELLRSLITEVRRTIEDGVLRAFVMVLAIKLKWKT
jgi:predicted RNA-binding protein